MGVVSRIAYIPERKRRRCKFWGIELANRLKNIYGWQCGSSSYISWGCSNYPLGRAVLLAESGPELAGEKEHYLKLKV